MAPSRRIVRSNFEPPSGDVVHASQRVATPADYHRRVRVRRSVGQSPCRPSRYYRFLVSMASVSLSGDQRASTLASTGISGLDEVLSGGLTPHRLYLLEGVPGSGKTTLAMQFLLEGVRQGESVLYVTLSESEDELRGVAESHDWSLDGLTVRELAPSEDTLRPDDQYTMFHPSEVELGATIETILADVERIKPSRIVFDSLSELRLLAGTALGYRRQILALKQFIAHGAIRLEQTFPEYGNERRRLLVLKYRGHRFRGGYHDYVIRPGGLVVFPRLVASEHRPKPVVERLHSGLDAMDTLLGGGIERGTSTLVIGAAGTGKSTLAAHFVTAAAERGQKSAMFLFDENVTTLLSRTASLGIDLARHYADGRVTLQQIDPAELSPGEFTHAIRHAVEELGVTIVVIDSLSGFLNAMPGEKFLVIQLHEVLSYLGQKGVATLLIGAQQGLIGSAMITPVDASYLADAVVLMRYYETRGEVRQAISVMKKRSGSHERTIRDFRMEQEGIRIGQPLRDFRGILTGVPIREQDDGDVIERSSN
jgi:circadian clock protein KaiC